MANQTLETIMDLTKNGFQVRFMRDESAFPAKVMRLQLDKDVNHSMLLWDISLAKNEKELDEELARGLRFAEREFNYEFERENENVSP